MPPALMNCSAGLTECSSHFSPFLGQNNPTCHCHGSPPSSDTPDALGCRQWERQGTAEGLQKCTGFSYCFQAGLDQNHSRWMTASHSLSPGTGDQTRSLHRQLPQLSYSPSPVDSIFKDFSRKAISNNLSSTWSIFFNVLPFIKSKPQLVPFAPFSVNCDF